VCKPESLFSSKVAQKKGIAGGVWLTVTIAGLHSPCAGLRIGLYTPIKQLLGAEGRNAPLASKVAAGMLSGALAAGIANPTDLIKTQMQKGAGAHGGPFTVMARVVRAEGVRGLWVGTTPSMVSAGQGTAGADLGYACCSSQKAGYHHDDLEACSLGALPQMF
jgi:hypothetical protein